MAHNHRYKTQKLRNLRKKKRFYQFWLFWFMIFLIAIIGVSAYLVLFFPKVQILHIEILGNEKVGSQDIENLVLNNVNKNILGTSSKSIFLVNSDEVKKNILIKFPVAEDVRVQKKYFSGLTIIMQERKPFSTFCQTARVGDIKNECFLIDKNGVIFEKFNDSTENGMIITSKDSKEVFIGENVVSNNIMDSIIKIHTNLKQNFSIDIKEALVSNPLIFTTFENWKIYFDPNADINLQIAKMNLLLKNEVSATARKNLQYIYLQYKDRAYFK